MQSEQQQPYFLKVDSSTLISYVIFYVIHMCARSIYTGDVYIDQTVYHCTISLSSCVLHCYCVVIVNNHASRANA